MFVKVFTLCLVWLLFGFYSFYTEACQAAEQPEKVQIDYMSTARRYQENGQYLLAILNFQQAMRLAPTAINSEALQQADECARKFAAIKSFPAIDKETSTAIMREADAMKQDWNKHDLQSEMAHFDDAYIDNDGFTKANMTDITSDIWKMYPDAQSDFQILGMSVQGDCAVIDCADAINGHTKDGMKDNDRVPHGDPGRVSNSNRGLLFLKLIDEKWKVVGRVYQNEDTVVSYGESEPILSTLQAPYAVRQDTTFTVVFRPSLPPNRMGVGSIVYRTLTYPPSVPKEVWRPIDADVLQRQLNAGSDLHNIEIMATLGLRNDNGDAQLTGLQLRTKRVNVIPKEAGFGLLELLIHGAKIPSLQLPDRGAEASAK